MHLSYHYMDNVNGMKFEKRVSFDMQLRMA